MLTCPAVSLSAARTVRLFDLPFGVLTDAVLVAYACWTIGANVAVVSGGAAHALVAAGALVVLALGALVFLLRQRPALWRAYLADLMADPPTPARTFTRASLAVMLAGPALTLLAWLVTGNAWVAWFGLAASALVSLAFALREPLEPAAAGVAPIAPSVRGGASSTTSESEQFVLHVLALCCALFSLLVVRPRADDTFYLNMAVSVVDFPQQALLSLRNLHGPASATIGVQHVFPPYRVHSFELLGGLLSYVSGMEVARVVHLVLATAFCWLTPFAVARLLRLLMPRSWLLGVGVVIAFYMIEGTAARGYANHALVRMFNGKSVLLTVAAPLICAAGLRYGARSSGIRLLLLALAQVAGLGLSSTGLWLAPTLAMVSVAAGTPHLRQLPKRLSGSLLSSAYVLALGLWVLGQLGTTMSDPAEVEGRAESTNAAMVESSVPPHFGELAEAIPVVLGPERTAIALLTVGWLAGPLAPSVLGLRFFSMFAALVAWGFGNPFLSKLIARYVTGASTYQRIFWLLPVAIGLAACCGSLFGQLSKRFTQPASLALSLAALAAFFAVATQRPVLSAANQAKLEFPPAVKLWPHARSEAEEVCRWAPEGKYVLASQAVSLQLPILHGCGYPLATFDRWLTASEEEKQVRYELVQLIDDRTDISADKATWFIGELARHHVDTIVLSHAAAHNTRVKGLIRLADFERVAVFDWDQIFVRTRPATRLENEGVAREVCRNAPRDHGALAPFEITSVLERLGCTQPVTARKSVLSASESEFDDLLMLERVVYLESDLSKHEQAQVSASMQRRDIATVVMSKEAKGNKWLKTALNQLGFRKARSVSEYSIWTRATVP
jgi:hypothetical protein